MGIPISLMVIDYHLQHRLQCAVELLNLAISLGMISTSMGLPDVYIVTIKLLVTLGHYDCNGVLKACK